MIQRNFSGNKDADREILLKLHEDKDLLSVCSVSKYALTLCNEDFFRNRMQNKYPVMKKLKDKNMKWKQYYLYTVYYVDKLKREFNFNFESTSEDPKGHYDVLLKDYPDLGVEISARKGWLDLVKYFIEKVDEDKQKIIDDINPIIEVASKGDNFENATNIVKYLIELKDPYMKPETLNLSLRHASSKGNKQLINYLLSLGVNDYNSGLRGAVEGGKDDLINFFIEKGANDWDNAILSAASSGREDLVFRFINYAKTTNNINLNDALYNAAYSGNENLVKYFISLGADNWESGLTGAAQGDNRKLVDYFISMGANNWYSARNVTKYNSSLYKFFSKKIQEDYPNM